MQRLKSFAKGAAGRLLTTFLPLTQRKRFALSLQRSNLPGRAALTFALLSDLARIDPDAFHRFLWSHHLAYAESYEPREMFGIENLHPLRRELLELLTANLRAQNVVPEMDVASVLDVGCSLGYLLRHIETDVFPSAQTLVGLDVDSYAVRVGTQHLKAIGSRVELITADMSALDSALGGRTFDVVMCCGALLYLAEETAASAVQRMLSHARYFVAMNDLACGEIDNASLDASRIRASDHGFIHNLDDMVRRAGGQVVARRWGGREVVGGNSVYLLVAQPGAAVRQSNGPAAKGEHQ